MVFLVASSSYEAALIGFSLWLGGIEYHTFAIQGRIFAVRSVALVGLLILDHIGIALGLAPPVRGSTPLAMPQG